MLSLFFPLCSTRLTWSDLIRGGFKPFPRWAALSIVPKDAFIVEVQFPLCSSQATKVSTSSSFTGNWPNIPVSPSIGAIG